MEKYFSSLIIGVFEKAIPPLQPPSRPAPCPQFCGKHVRQAPDTGVSHGAVSVLTSFRGRFRTENTGTASRSATRHAETTHIHCERMTGLKLGAVAPSPWPRSLGLQKKILLGRSCSARQAIFPQKIEFFITGGAERPVCTAVAPL